MKKYFYRKAILFAVFMFPLFCCQSQQKVKAVYLADPTIFYDNSTYFLYGTAQDSEKGFPVLISKDLKKWYKDSKASNSSYVLEKGKHTFGTKGFWAPQVFLYNKKYYMLYTANESIAIAESNTPSGPFIQEKVTAISGTTKQIDPYLFVDDDGKKYLYHVRLGGGNKIYVAEFKDDFSGIKDETLKQCISAEGGWENTDNVPAPPITEGPTVIKHKGIYYLIYSANDFRSIDYAVGYATSKSPFGPWIKYEKNPIIDRHIIGRNGTGHGDMFKDAKGDYHYVFHTHNSDSLVVPRQTFIIGLKFRYNKITNSDEIIVNKNSLITPTM